MKIRVLHSGYVQRVKRINSLGGSTWLKKHTMRTTTAKFRQDIKSLGSYMNYTAKVSGASEASEIVDLMKKQDDRREEVIDDISKQSATAAQKIIEDQLTDDKTQIRNITDPAAMLKVYEKLKAKKQRIEAEVIALKSKAPSFNDLVAGEFHAVSQYTDRKAVVRMMGRLKKQLKRTLNATSVEKQKSVLQVANANARLYAHQVAHATHKKYLDFKLHRLDKTMAGVKSDIAQLKPQQSKTTEDDEHLLNKINHNDVTNVEHPQEIGSSAEHSQESGSSEEEFRLKSNSWAPESSPSKDEEVRQLEAD